MQAVRVELEDTQEAVMNSVMNSVMTYSYSAREGWRSVLRRARTGIVLVTLLVATLTLLTACGPFPTSPSVVTQGQGLPSLRHLDWGFAAINHPVWSPDGRWIAALAGDDYAGAHVEVVSPDGQTKYDLSSWHCGEGSDPDFAWLPDGRLSCINGDTPYPQMCIGAAPFNSCTATHLSQEIIGDQRGLAWTPDGRSALFPARSNDVPRIIPISMYWHHRELIQQMLPFSEQYGVATPSFVPMLPSWRTIVALRWTPVALCILIW